MSKKIIIIGAGISGLTAGVYARIAGFEAEIYESHRQAGGNCTGWTRGEYHIDGCIEWVTGTRENSSLHDIWTTTGALASGTEVYLPEEIVSTFHEGKIYHLYSQTGKMEETFMRLSPEDAPAIKKLIKYVRQKQHIKVPVKKPFERPDLWELSKLGFHMLKAGMPDRKTSRLSVKEFVAQFKSPVIRRLLSCTVHPDMPSYALFFSLGTRTSGDGGWMKGGSLQFAGRIRQRFEDLGGVLHLNKEVKEIIIKNGKATGIRLQEDAAEIPADYVIPAIDAYALLHKLLGGKYKSNYFEKRFNNPDKYIISAATHVALGVKADLGGCPHHLCIEPEQPFAINGTNITQLNVKTYNHDATFTAAGRSLITVLLRDAHFDHWKALKEHSEESYTQEKERLGAWVIKNLLPVFPQLEDQLEMIDIATPLTFHRYCHTYKGAYMSFLPGARVRQEFNRGRIKGIKNLYLAGQWVAPTGGLPMAAATGKFAIQRICRKEHIKLKIKN
ncbi:MAG: NAD(P)/FAD-dependent oxidoreductase [Prevotellaceae bacterium]|jgi:phytoene dehydrogenase-like protein|nr:NAD(P)/FAD-dependent oxidoreductase [Prevotellaceae bacterium]